MRKKQERTRNPIARDLRTPKYKKRVITSRKIYNRKREKEIKNDINDGKYSDG